MRTDTVVHKFPEIACAVYAILMVVMTMKVTINEATYGATVSAYAIRSLKIFTITQTPVGHVKTRGASSINSVAITVLPFGLVERQMYNKTYGL